MLFCSMSGDSIPKPADRPNRRRRSTDRICKPFAFSMKYVAILQLFQLLHIVLEWVEL